MHHYSKLMTLTRASVLLLFPEMNQLHVAYSLSHVTPGVVGGVHGRAFWQNTSQMSGSESPDGKIHRKHQKASKC